MTVAKPVPSTPPQRRAVTQEHGKLRLRMLPAPDEENPAKRLQGILADTGLELRGVDLVDAAGS